ncbi:MAG: type II toxin-antitoxin system VapC family toxin [Acidobacteria bacterium]|nr:type II toxin-antitoxin system VapC family toxin [Acidobacteriota bacterium]
MKRKVYIETSVASYLTARPSRDLVAAANQELTYEWWTYHRGRYELYVSDVVLREAARGDAEAAARRLSELRDIDVLAIDVEALTLSRIFLQRKLLPPAAVEDALHVAIATVEGMDFLLTWNCRHIANGEIFGQLAGICQEFGYVAPILCTPQQLMGD